MAQVRSLHYSQFLSWSSSLLSFNVLVRYDFLIFDSDPVLMMKPQYTELLLGVLIYGLGAGLYASKFPERCKPGTFDMCGHSH